MSTSIDPPGGKNGANPVSVFGASGRLGRQVVAELLHQGHAAVAFVHSNNPFDARSGLRIVQVDVHDQVAVVDAIAGSRGVIATLASAAASVKDVASAGTHNIVLGMAAHGIVRIVSTTGSAARDDLEIGTEHPHLLARRTAMLSFNPELLLDGELHLRLLRGSGLDWTVIRAPRMMEMDHPSTATVLSEQPPDPATVLPYRAVARAIVTEFFALQWRHAAPFISPK